MKIIKLFVILLIMLSVTVSCTSSSSLDLSIEGVIELCEERSDNTDEFIQCISDQNDACGEIIFYLNATEQLEKCRKCIKIYTDNKNRTDFVMVSKCLGKAI